MEPDEVSHLATTGGCSRSDTPWDVCSSGAHNCDAAALCQLTPGSFTCTCPPGFRSVDEGVFCLDTDECAADVALSAILTGVPDKSSTFNPGYDDLSVVTDGDFTNFVGVGGVSETVWVTLDLGVTRALGAVTTLHNIVPTESTLRRYRKQSIQLSSTGEFGGEEEVVFACDDFTSCGEERQFGIRRSFAPQPARYVRIGIGRNDKTNWAHLSEVRVHAPWEVSSPAAPVSSRPPLASSDDFPLLGFLNAWAVVDGVIDPASYAVSGAYSVKEMETCGDVAYLTVDLGQAETLDAVTVWHYHSAAEPRQYCSQSIDLSQTGMFAGEETRVFACGTYAECGDATAAGQTATFAVQRARYIRVGSGRSNINGAAVILEVEPRLAAMSECHVSASCVNTRGSFACSCNAGYDDVSSGAPGSECEWRDTDCSIGYAQHFMYSKPLIEINSDPGGFVDVQASGDLSSFGAKDFIVEFEFEGLESAPAVDTEGMILFTRSDTSGQGPTAMLTNTGALSLRMTDGKALDCPDALPTPEIAELRHLRFIRAGLQLLIFVDHELKCETTITDGDDLSLDLYVAFNIRFGGSLVNDNTQRGDGRLHNVRIYAGAGECDECAVSAGDYCPAGSTELGGTSCPAGSYCTGQQAGSWKLLASNVDAESTSADWRLHAWDGALYALNRDKVYEYDIDGDSWSTASTTGSSLPGTVKGSGVALWEGVLYVFGGSVDSQDTDDFYSYTIGAARWELIETALGSPGVPRSGLEMVAWEGILYLFGGSTTSGVVRDFRSYTIATGTWTDLNSPWLGTVPQSGLNPQMVAWEGYIFVFGGTTNSGSETNDLFSYSIGSRTWMDLNLPVSGVPPTARSAHRMAVVDGVIFVFGGQRQGTNLDDLHKYSVSTGSWSNLTDLAGQSLPPSTRPSAREMHGMAVWGSKIYIFGGRELKDLHSYSLGPCPTDQFCSEGIVAPFDCQVGTFSATGQSSCTDCPAGSFSDVTGTANECTECYCLQGEEPQGCGLALKGTCVACATGKYKSFSGSAPCTVCDNQCDAGAEKLDCGGALPGRCTDCPKDTYKESAGIALCAACESCSAGEWRADCGGASGGECVACDAGTYKPAAGSEACTDCACDAGEERLDCGPISAGACEACKAGSYKPAPGTELCTACGACSAAFERVQCGGAEEGSCAQCQTGWYKMAVGTEPCAHCGEAHLHAIRGGEVALGAEVELPSGHSLVDEEGTEAYLLHARHPLNGHFTRWILPVAPGEPPASTTGNFVVRSRVLFRSLPDTGESGASFALWNEALRHEVCFYCDARMYPRGAQWDAAQWERKASTVSVDVEYEVEVIRQNGKLEVKVDDGGGAILVYNDPEVPFDFPVSYVGWRPGRADMQIYSLSMEFDNQWCAAGWERTDCGEAVRGTCAECPYGVSYKETDGDGSCTNCDFHCPAGQQMVDCGGASAGSCEACLPRTFKPEAGEEPCVECPPCVSDGYVLVGCEGASNGTCVDKLECQDDEDNCDTEATCDNTIGSFECRCNVGYEGDGTIGNCLDVLECQEGLDDCDINAKCDNIVGSFECACNHGYDGNGTQCYGHWTVSPVGASRPTARQMMGFAASDAGALYVFGGVGADGQLLNDLHAYDTSEGSWEALTQRSPAVPPPRRSMGFAYSHHTLYVFGGEGIEGDTSDMHAYKILDRSWAPAPSREGNPPTARRGMGFYAAAGMIYVFGGRTSAAMPSSDLHQYRVATGTWSTLHADSGEAPSSRYGMGFTLTATKLVVYGGFDTATEDALNDVHLFDLDARAWAPALETPAGLVEAEARRWVGWTGAGDALVLLGAIDSDAEADRDLALFDATVESWVWLPGGANPPAAQAGVGMARVHEKVYVFGGETQSGILVNEMHQFPLVDMCSIGAHNCDVNAECTISGGGFECKCREGFAGEGTVGTCCDRGGVSVNGRCWRLVEGLVDRQAAWTHAEAQQLCGPDGTLAGFASPEEWTSVGAALGMTEATGRVWIGLGRPNASAWQWEGGTGHLSFDGQWADKEPMISEAGAMCVQADASSWFAVDCGPDSTAAGFVCSEGDGAKGQTLAPSLCDGQLEAFGRCWLALHAAKLTYAQAESVCSSWGGTLAGVRSEAELELARDLLGGATAWVGLRVEGEVETWADGYSPRAWATAYKLAQDKGAANQNSGEQLCMSLSSSAAGPSSLRLYPESCEAKPRSALCSKRSDLRCDGDAVANGRCWVLGMGQSSYSEALADCKSWNGQLAHVRSAADLDVVKALGAQQAWVGLRRIGKQWMFVNGMRPWWDGGLSNTVTPANDNGAEMCALYDATTADLRAKPCASGQLAFVCSKALESECEDGDASAFGRCWVHSRDVALPFDEAKEACRGWGGELATVRSATEHAFLRGAGVGRDGRYSWTGLESQFASPLLWLDGMVSFYAPWQAQHPSAAISCTATQGSTWISADCTEARAFTCTKFEREEEEPECNGDLSTESKCWMLLVNTAGLTYFDADQTCGEWGGSLASIRSAEEYAAVSTIAALVKVSEVWFGLRRLSSRTVWFWEDGSPRLSDLGPPGRFRLSDDICAYMHLQANGTATAAEWRFGEGPCNHAFSGALCSKYHEGFEPESEPESEQTDPQDSESQDEETTCDGQLHLDGKCFYAVEKVGLSYVDADAACAKWGGRLASIVSPSEQAEVAAMLAGDGEGGEGRFWVGLRRGSRTETVAGEGASSQVSQYLWSWEDGTPRLSAIGPPGTLQSDEEICSWFTVNAERTPQLVFHEGPCSGWTEHLLCSRYTDPARRPQYASEDCDGHVEKDGKCWLAAWKVALSYEDAAAACEDWGGTLASVLSSEEEATLAQIPGLAEHKSDFWVGLRRNNSRTVWRWDDGAQRLWPAGPPGTFESEIEVCASARVEAARAKLEVEYREGFCTEFKDLVCSKYTTTPRPHPLALKDPDCDGQRKAHGKCWLAIEKVGLSYYDAEAACAEWHPDATLASLLSPEESFDLEQLGGIVAEDSAFWVGLRRENSSEIWKWSDSAPRFWNVAPPGQLKSEEGICMSVSVKSLDDATGLVRYSYLEGPCDEAMVVPHLVCSRFERLRRTIQASRSTGLLLDVRRIVKVAVKPLGSLKGASRSLD